MKNAIHALEADAPERARTLLLAETEPLLADWRAVFLGETLLRLGALEEAQATLRSVPKTPREKVPCRPECLNPAWPEAQLRLARVHAATNTTKAALRAAEILLALPLDEDRFGEALGYLEKSKDRASLAAARKRIVLEIPETPTAKRLVQQHGLAALLGKDEKRTAAMTRVRTLLDTHENDRAHRESIGLLAKLGDADPRRCELMYIIGKSGRKLRKYKTAVRWLSKARKTCKTLGVESFELRSSLLEVQVRGIRRNVSGIERNVRVLETKHGEHSFVDDALFQLAEAYERTGATKQGRKVYAKIIERYPKGDQADRAAWRLAYAALRAGDDTGANTFLGGVEARSRRGIDVSRALYWKARIIERSKRESCDAYRKVVFDRAPNFYTWLALGRMDAKCKSRSEKELLAWLAQPVPELGPQPAVDHHTVARRAEKLARQGLDELALLELTLLEHDGLSESETIALGLRYDAVGGHREAQWLLRRKASRALSRPPRGKDMHAWKAAYSRPFASEIESAAREEKLDPLFFTALVREESTFDPNIVSWAGATGLAQLMPGTAMMAYADLGRGRLDLERLTEPALNLRLGARVLGDGLRRFGQPPLALAAYNGGHGLAKKTLPQAKNTAFDHWAEEVFVKQTRRYVKKVMSTYGIYRFLYEKALLELPKTVPQR